MQQSRSTTATLIFIRFFTLIWSISCSQQQARQPDVGSLLPQRDMSHENPDSALGTGLSIHAVVPSDYSTSGGIPLQIEGTGFAEGATVRIGAASAEQVRVVTSGRIICLLPQQLGFSGKVPITVENRDGSSISRGDLFAYHSSLFGLQAALPKAADGPTRIVLADFNKDNKIDYAIANFKDKTVTVLLGNGLGGYSAVRTTPIGAAPIALVAADLNLDGKLDLAVSSGSAAAVFILLGDGTGAFGAPRGSAVGENPYSLVMGDA